MWSFSYTKCKRIVCRTKIYFTQHQHIVKRVHHLKKNQQNNRQNNKILTNRAKAHTHNQIISISSARKRISPTHTSKRRIVNLWICTLTHTNRETVNFYSKLYSTTHHEQANLHLRSLCIWRKEKTLNQTKSYPKTSFCINNTLTQPSMNIIPNSSGERVVVQTEKRDKYQTRIVFLYNPHYPPYYYYNYYWICNVTLPTHQYNKQKKHKSKRWKNKKHSTQINPTFLERLL